jgi:hypothetical protein
VRKTHKKGLGVGSSNWQERETSTSLPTPDPPIALTAAVPTSAATSTDDMRAALRGANAFRGADQSRADKNDDEDEDGEDDMFARTVGCL